MKTIIEVSNLSFAYEKNKKVLDDLNASFQEGRIIALIGKNGSGKSTFLDCLLGTNEYDGNIFIQGHNIKNLSSKEYARLVSFIPQSIQINIDYSIRDFISFGRNPHLKFGLALADDDYKKVENNAERCGIKDLLDKDINKVSGGERQLAFVARALTQETPVIIMDEPTASLDFGNQQKLFRTITTLAKEGKTILFTTHNPNHLVKLDCDIYYVNEGKLEFVSELNEEKIEKIYGEEFAREGKAFIFKL